MSQNDTSKSAEATAQLSGVAAADRAREELRETLELLGARLDFAQRIDDKIIDTRIRFAEVRRRKPFVYAAVIAGAAVATGLTVWAVSNAIANALQKRS